MIALYGFVIFGIAALLVGVLLILLTVRDDDE